LCAIVGYVGGALTDKWEQQGKKIQPSSLPKNKIGTTLLKWQVARQKVLLDGRWLSARKNVRNPSHGRAPEDFQAIGRK
jgi:hypothetical protein